MTRHATTPIAAALGQGLRAQQGRIVARWPRAIQGQVEAVHRMRVGSRRLRELLAVVATVAPRSGAVRARRELRRVTQALGPVRELDVALHELGEASGRHDWPRDQVAIVRRLVEEKRDRRRRRMARRLSRKYWRALEARLGNLALVVEHMPDDDRVWRRALAVRVAGRAARVLTAIVRCGTLYAPERLHALRIAVKKLRYTLEIAGDAGDTAVPATFTTLRRAQEAFGHLHDVQVLLGEVHQSAAVPGRARRTTVTALAAIADALDRECREAHARILPQFGTLLARVAQTRRDIMVGVRTPRVTMVKAAASVAAARKRPAKPVTARAVRRADRGIAS